MPAEAAVDTGVAGFEAATSPHRRELHVHSYRMLASYDDAEDAVQETYLRAWRGWAGFDGEHVRAWLYRIATNVCLDLIRVRQRQAPRAATDVAWLTPYPDRLLDELPSTEESPDDVAVARETVELAFLAALQVLPPRQRAALLAREVLGLPAAETAALLDTSVAAANSALQRARATMQEHLPSHRADWTARPAGPEERELLARFIDAHERYDAAAALAIAAEDIRITMPPYPMRFDGRDGFVPHLERAFGPGCCRRRPTGCRRRPATCAGRGTGCSAPTSSTC
jgi:RNA polymerase sigma-70 factor (TIGR02960 family)